jgi:signal transduction histidine kinase/CheY-like chemotaxis protein
VIGGRTVGILALENLERIEAFTQDDLAFATFLGTHLAMTVNNARLQTMVPERGDWQAAELNTIQALAKSVPVGLLIVDQTRFRVWGNAAFCEMTGFERGELEGSLQQINQFLVQDTQALAQMVGDGPVDLTLARRDKSACSVKAVFLTFDTLGIRYDQGYIGVFEDLSERNSLEEKLFHMQRLSSVNTLMSGVAHELNNPLTAVICFAEWLLARDDMPPGCSKDLETIAKQAKRGMNIVRELLNYVRLEIHNPVLVDLNYVVRQLVRFRGHTADGAGCGINLDLSEAAPQVLGDTNQLQQLLLNLINNAEQACRSAGRPSTIRISTRTIGQGQVRLSVRDNGPGIPAEAQPHIFEPFYTTWQNADSTGLGLTICEQIVKRHHGTISFTSVEDKGTTFEIDLPLEASSVPVDKYATCPMDARDSRSAARILVVDDEKSISSLLAKVMTRCGHQVDIALNGRDAIQQLQESAYDIVFLDLKIPGLSGQAIYEWIKQNHSHLVQRTVILTGDILNSDTLDFLHQEGMLHLLKPFQLAELRDILGQVWPA